MPSRLSRANRHALPMVGLTFAISLVAVSAPVCASDADASASDAAGAELASGDDMESSLVSAAAYESGFSFNATSSWAAASRSWQLPQPHGLVGLAVARVMYGTSWSVMLSAMGILTRAVAGPDWSWVQQAWYDTGQLVGHDLPGGCSELGADGGCGLGVGAWGSLRAKIRGTPLWLATGGGWIQGRFDSDARRTLVESTWVLSPISVQAEVSPRAGPLRLNFGAGAGLFFGLHNAHVHPRVDSNLETQVPWHEMFVLDGGAGGGAVASASIMAGEALWLVAEGELAPLPLGGPVADPSRLVRPLEVEQGLVTWRSLSFGVSFPLARDVRLGLRYWMAEMSARPVYLFGHRALMFRWDVPLRRP